MPVSVVEYEEATVVSILGATVILACRRDVEDPQVAVLEATGVGVGDCAFG